MKTQLTIADYISRYQTISHTETKDRSFLNNPQQTETFEDILSAAKQKQVQNKGMTSAAPGNKGMTLQYYLKNPVQIHYASAPTSQDGNNEENSTIPAITAPDDGEKSAILEKNPTAVKKNKNPYQKNEDVQVIRQKIDTCIKSASQKYDVPEELIRGIVRAESGFQPNVVSSAGAQGLMQLMPGTAKELGVTDPFDIKENIEGGVRYFKQMLNQFDNDVELSLAAYNAGPGTVRRYNGIPPYAETRQYVSKVIQFSNDIV